MTQGPQFRGALLKAAVSKVIDDARAALQALDSHRALSPLTPQHIAPQTYIGLSEIVFLCLGIVEVMHGQTYWCH